MKAFEKMTKLEFTVFFLMSICSGLTIGIGGTAALTANAMYETWGKLIGAGLFTIGIYAIIIYDMRLFTGMVSAIPSMGWKNSWRLLICFIGNAVGVAIIALLVYFTPLADTVIPQAKALATTKLSANNWAISALCSSILCGLLITLSVWSVNHATKKNLSTTLGVLFPIAVFAFCGFDHSVANILKRVDVIDKRGEQTERKVHHFFAQLPARIQNGSARSRADARMAVVDMDDGFL